MEYIRDNRKLPSYVYIITSEQGKREAMVLPVIVDKSIVIF